jgi:tight adherence protein C
MQPELLIALVAVFIGVAVATGAIARAVLLNRTPARRRLQTAAAGPAGDLVLPAPMLTDTPSPVAKKIARAIPKSPKEMGILRRRLTSAGYRGIDAAILFSAIKVGTAIALAVATFMAIGRGGFGIFISLFGMVIGFMVPDFWLAHRTKRRQKVIRNGLPDALDLFIVCLEAGSSLDQAIVKASVELDIAYPALAEELRLITMEVRAGKPRLEAFKNFAERTRVDDVRALVAMLVQTDRFGTSVAQALRTHADQARTKRRQVAEEKAAKLTVKLVIPLVLFLFPALYVVVLGPAVIKIMHVFATHGR